MYLLPLYIFFSDSPPRNTYRRRKNSIPSAVTIALSKQPVNEESAIETIKNGKIIRLPRQLFGLELGSSTLVVLFYFGQ
jgi:hypothetical protein